MKTGKVTIQGKDYITALSTRVMFHLQEKNGRSIAEEIDHIVKETDMKSLFWLLNEMLVAGDVYATKEHIEHNTPPTFDDLIDLVGIDDYETMFSGLTSTVANGTQADIDVKAKKDKAL